MSFLTPPPSGELALPFEELVDQARVALPPDFPSDIRQVLFGLDIDGTLITGTGASRRVRSAIHDLREAGAQVIISTGRGPGATAPILAELGIERAITVCSNGASIVEWDPDIPGGARLLHTREFIPAAAIDIVQAVIPDVLIGVETLQGYLLSAEFPPGELIEWNEVAPLEDLREMSTPKVIFRAPSMTKSDFRHLLLETPLGQGHEVNVGWTSWADVSPKGCSKATALETLASEYGIPHSGTVTIGDGANDVEMIDWAAFGVAMGGAGNWIKRRAQHVAGAVENDGAAAVMRAILER